jgi:hypothetical protein
MFGQGVSVFFFENKKYFEATYKDLECCHNIIGRQ